MKQDLLQIVYFVFENVVISDEHKENQTELITLETYYSFIDELSPMSNITKGKICYNLVAVKDKLSVNGYRI